MTTREEELNIKAKLMLQQKLFKLDPAQQVSYLNGRKVKNLQYCHYQIKHTAKALAAEFYEEAMRNNENRKAWLELTTDLKNEKERQAEWVNLMWPKLIDNARATLARLLGTNISEGLKQSIYRALLLDSQVKREKKQPQRLFRP